MARVAPGRQREPVRAARETRCRVRPSERAKSRPTRRATARLERSPLARAAGAAEEALRARDRSEPTTATAEEN